MNWPTAASYTTASSPTNGVAAFDRGAAGALSQRPDIGACVTSTGGPSCVNAIGAVLNSPAGIVVSPDGLNAYVAGATNDIILGLRRDLIPVCSSVSRAVPQAPTGVDLPCTDRTATRSRCRPSLAPETERREPWIR